MTNTLVEPPARPRRRSPRAVLEQRRQAYTDAVAQRLHDRLAADPSSYRRTPSQAVALVIAVAVLVAATVYVALVVLLAVVCFVAPQWWTWPLLALALLTLAAARPRRPGFAGLLVTDPEKLPATRRLVAEIAERVGVRPPRLLGLTYHLNAHVQLYGWRGRRLLAIGLPMWNVLTPSERVALLGHELGHLHHGDTTSGRVIGSADRVLTNALSMLRPGRVQYRNRYGGRAGIPVVEELAMVLMGTLCLPLVLLRWRLRRSFAHARQHREYLADRRASEIAGSLACRQTFARDFAGAWTRASAGVRRGEDAFEAFAAPAPDEAGIAAHVARSRLEPLRADDSHPADHLRISLLDACPVDPTDPVDDALLAAADAELRRVMAGHTKDMRDRLVTRYYR